MRLYEMRFAKRKPPRKNGAAALGEISVEPGCRRVLECAAMKRTGLLLLSLLLLSSAYVRGADARAAEDRLQFANALFARGLNAQAAAEYEALLADAPAGTAGLDAAWFRLGEARRMLGKGEEALVAYEKAAEFAGSPFREKALFKRAAVFTQLGLDEAAEELYAGLLADKPSGEVLEMALYYHGDALRALGRGDEALAEFDRQLREFPKGSMSAYARLQLGKLLSLPGPKRDLGRATALLRALADDPPEPRLAAEALFLAGAALSDAGDFAGAARFYRELFDKYPGDPRAAEARFPAAWAFCKSGRPQDALAAAETALAATPPPDAAHALELAYVRAQALFELSRLAEAADAFSRIAASSASAGSPLRPRASYQAALCRFKAGDGAGALGALSAALADPELRADEAIQDYRRLANEFPEHPDAPDALYRLGHQLRLRGAHADAAAAFHDLAAKHPDSPLAPIARLAAASALSAAGKGAEAIVDWQTYVRDYPAADGVAEALFQQGAELLRLGRKAEAAAALDRLVREFPKSPRKPDALFWRGAVLRENGDLPAAEAAFRGALAANPGDDVRRDARFALATTLQAAGKSDEAAKLFEELVADPVRARFTSGQFAWLAQHQYDAKQFARAADTARLMAEQADDPAWKQAAWTLAGRAERAAGRAPEAEAAFRAACDVDARSEYLPEATLRLAELLLARGETKGADEQFRKAVERCSDDEFKALRIHAYAGLARTALASGDKDAAASYFLTICLLYHDPELVPPLAREALPLLDELGRADEAKTLREMLEREY